MSENSYSTAADIKTPHGLKLGTRVLRNGKHVMRYKQGKQFDELTAKQAVECIEGIKIKDLIIIPEDETSA